MIRDIIHFFLEILYVKGEISQNNFRFVMVKIRCPNIDN